MTEEEKDYVEISPSSSEIIDDIEEQPLDEEAFDEEAAEEDTEVANTKAFGDIAEESDAPEVDSDIEITTESVVEAVLFASDESLTAERLANIIETSAKQIRQHIEKLNEKYKANANAFTIEKIAGGYQMLTLSPYNNWLRKLLRVRSDSKLSAAALETLAIIAYKQPVIRADIEAIRGVAAGDMIRNLMYKGLVKIVGRAEVLGRPMLYGTTKKFLEIFGLNSLKDLPKIEKLRKPVV